MIETDDTNSLTTSASFKMPPEGLFKKESKKTKKKLLKSTKSTENKLKETKLPLYTSYDDDLEICQCQAYSENDDEPNQDLNLKCTCEAKSTTTKSASSICSSPLSHDHKKCWSTMNSMSGCNSSCCDINNLATSTSTQASKTKSKKILNSKLSKDAGYSSDHESNTCLELCCNVDSHICSIDDCKFFFCRPTLKHQRF
jgi:hypothetical protein